jgi:hypothetical protein
MAFKKVLLKGEPIGAREVKRLLPGLDVSKWDRLHFHISAGTRAIGGIRARVLFGTPVNGVILLADSTVWFEDASNERDFSYATPTTYGGSGFVMSVPVVAPLLYDVILTNLSEGEIPKVYVTVMAQEV